MRDINELIKSNNECMEKIDEKYWELRNLIVSYIRVKLAEEESEEAINDILDIFLEAQSRGEDLNKVIGEDYIKFSDEFIKAYKYKEKFYFLKKIKKVVIEVIKIIPLIFAVEVLISAPYKTESILEFSSFSYGIKVRDIIMIIGTIALTYIGNYINLIGDVLDKKLKKKDTSSFILISIIILWSLLGCSFGREGNWSSIDLIMIPNYLICYIISLFILAYYLIKFVRSIFNYRKRYLEYIGGYRENEK